MVSRPFPTLERVSKELYSRGYGREMVCARPNHPSPPEWTVNTYKAEALLQQPQLRLLEEGLRLVGIYCPFLGDGGKMEGRRRRVEGYGEGEAKHSGRAGIREQ